MSTDTALFRPDNDIASCAVQIFGSHAAAADFQRAQHWLHRRCHAVVHMRQRAANLIDSGYCLDAQHGGLDDE